MNETKDKLLGGLLHLKENPDAPVIIHTGYLKCGSTFLQKEIFPKIKDVNMLSPYLTLTYQIYQDKINILSKESFCSNNIITDRLHNLFPQAKIIVILRDKEGLKKSCYNTYLKHCGTLTFEEYLVLNKEMYSRLLDYDSYLNHIKELFSDVYVDYLENLKKDNYAFVKGICDFIGVPVPDYNIKYHNVALTDRQIKLCRFLNRYFNSRHNNKGIFPCLNFFSPEILMRLVTGNIWNKSWWE